MKYLILIFLVGCQAQMGVGFHPETELNDEDSNPLGIIRIHAKTLPNTEVFCEHVSSFPDHDQGLNMCGALWRIY